MTDYYQTGTGGHCTIKLWLTYLWLKWWHRKKNIRYRYRASSPWCRAWAWASVMWDEPVEPRT